MDQETREVAVASPTETNGSPIFSWSYWQEGSTDTSRSDIARNFLLALAAFIGLGFGIWRAVTAHRQAKASLSLAKTASEQARIAGQGQITDRFSTAVEHLGSEQLPVRLGGVYALWRLVQEPLVRDLTSMIDILCAFVRHPPHKLAAPADKLRPDVQSILNLIGDKEAEYRDHLPPRYFLDLSSAELRSADLRDANLFGANLSEAVLSGADLRKANLTEANLSGAKLSEASLGGATLRSANFGGADLSGANLRGADLSGVILSWADLSDANLFGATLREANLSEAILSGADLSGADLSGADLSTANNLTQPQLDSACTRKGEEPPKLPEGLKPPTNICGEE